MTKPEKISSNEIIRRALAGDADSPATGRQIITKSIVVKDALGVTHTVDFIDIEPTTDDANDVALQREVEARRHFDGLPPPPAERPDWLDRPFRSIE